MFMPATTAGSVPERAAAQPTAQQSLLQANAVPLGLLGRWPATVLCPVCGQVSQTVIEYKTGNGTQ